MVVDFDWGFGVGRMCPFDYLASVDVGFVRPDHLVYLILVWAHCSGCSVVEL